jgi:hypothetical protein
MAKSRRLRFEPTPEQRRDVEMMAALRIPPEQMCQIVRHKNDKPISVRMFLRHFRREIETGATKVNASIVGFIIATILGTAPPDGGEPITDEGARVKLAISYLSTQLGWQTTARKELTNPTGPGGRPAPFDCRKAREEVLAEISNILRARGASGDPSG